MHVEGRYVAGMMLGSAAMSSEKEKIAGMDTSTMTSWYKVPALGLFLS